MKSASTKGKKPAAGGYALPGDTDENEELEDEDQDEDLEED